jgi:hypothetical protein
MRIEIPVSALARFVAGRQRIGNHLAQAARPEGDRPPAGHGRRQDVGPDHDLRGRLIWSAGRRVAPPVTATTDFLAPDILNKWGLNDLNAIRIPADIVTVRQLNAQL